MNLAPTSPEPEVSSRPDFSFRNTSLLPAFRNDLNITSVSIRGRSAYVVKDPISLKYFRWGEKERHLARTLDGNKSAAQVLEIMQKTFSDDDYDADDLRLTMSQFLNAGFLVTNGTLALQIYHQQNSLLKKAKRSKLWLTIPSKLISFKITLFDPDLLLLRMSKRLAFLWTWKASAVLFAMLAISGWLLTRDTGSLAGRMPDILGWQNLLIVWIVMIVVKIIHEFGHGLSCKHFGGEVHEMGAMFILFSPFLFCNATDSWVFKEKSKRLIVNFGGIYLELFLAALAAALWVLTPLGIFNQVCFNVMLVCSVMTIFFNVNPLMKFDGYYALSDWIEVPNLKERSDKALVTRIAGFFTGGQGIVRDPIVEQFKWPILTYAVASYIWTFFVAYNILRGIGYMLQPSGLDRIVQSSSGLVLLAGILAPPTIVGVQIMKILKSDESHTILRRVLFTITGLTLAFGALYVIPMPVNVQTACAINAANIIRITAASPGFVKQVPAHDGMRVKTGETLANLSNPELEKSLEHLKLQLESVLMRETHALAKQMNAQIPALRALAAQYNVAITKYSADIDALVVRSPVDGLVIGRNLQLKRGTLLRQGDLLCEILPDGPLEVVVALTESQAGLVAKAQSVTFRLLSAPSVTWTGEVLDIASSPSVELPHQSLGQHAGGTVPSVTSPSGMVGSDTSPTALPSSQVYRARIAVDNSRGDLRPGFGGRLKIHCGTKPLGSWLAQGLRNMIRSDFQL